MPRNLEEKRRLFTCSHSIRRLLSSGGQASQEKVARNHDPGERMSSNKRCVKSIIVITHLEYFI